MPSATSSGAPELSTGKAPLFHLGEKSLPTHGSKQPRRSREAATCPPTSIICIENSLPGSPPSEWDVPGAGSTNIQGFATNMSVNVGETAQFKVNTDATDYRVDIYRVGYYNGLGARKITTVQPSATLPQTQPNCLSDTTIGLIDCGNWAISASWAVPNDAVSGVYLANLVREDGTTGVSQIIFVVRDDARNSDLLAQTSDSTWQAYNTYGGNSLYLGSPVGRAYAVSYNRPVTTRGSSCCKGSVESYFFNSEYPMVRWLEANAYDVSYTSNVDTARRGAELLDHKVFLSVGHDEYWSNDMRNNVENARAQGVDLSFFSGNEVFWKTRWENSIDGSTTPFRTLVCYKETAANAKIDPSPQWTGTWRDPRFSPPSNGGRPENALTGTLHMVNGTRNDPMMVPAEYAPMRFWRNTSVANLSPGQTANFAAGMLGYEWDEAPYNGFQPAGPVQLSSTTIDVTPQYLLDFGSTYGAGVATHHLVLYRSPSGALVFGAGTTQWSWGLDAVHDRPGTPADIRIRQATVNLFADMGAQPATLQPDLVPATQSTDTAPPTSAISSPVNGATFSAKSPVTVQGTAADTGGGVVAAVEVSVDGGTTWRPATGRTNWVFTWTPTTTGTVKIQTRAVDDIGNLQATPTMTTVTVVNTLWPPTTTPAVDSNNDTKPVEIGVKFQSTAPGTITGIRFYKGAQNTGPHVGSLWTSSGQLLASATFTGETASGWQQVNFSTPVAVSAGTTYIASYHTASGFYSVTRPYFTTQYVNSPLTAPDSDSSGGNGVFTYGAANTFPTSTFQQTNYWVDVVFLPFSATNSLWPDTAVPAVPSHPDAAATTLGVKFQAATSGTITGIRFYKGAQNTGTHVGSLWTSSGQLLASATFTGETASGWQQVNFSTPVVVSAGTTYIASYHTTTGFYSVTRPYFTTQYVNSPLVALDSGSSGGNGVFTYGATSTFPTSTFQQTNYWVDVVFAPTSSDNTLWDDSAVPAVPSQPDSKAITLGVKFQAATSGTVSGIRFYKGAQNTGTHVGSLWTSSGQLLASATFTGETASGWQQVNFSTPVVVSAGTTYVASYHTTSGFYSVTRSYFTSPYVNGLLTALASGSSGGNGVFTYGATSTFPTSSFSATNYWVDLVFNSD
ncbi:hypothetical protein GCM10023194_24250 [Planotetraspora phitsanulokensis]